VAYDHGSLPTWGRLGALLLGAPALNEGLHKGRAIELSMPPDRLVLPTTGENFCCVTILQQGLEQILAVDFENILMRLRAAPCYVD
jgi:hypothetical protein